jgi:ABC-type transport system substrate-binding protein
MKVSHPSSPRGRWLPIFAAALLGSASLVAAIPAAAETHVRIGLVDSPKNYDPQKGSSGDEHHILYAVFDQLVRFDVNGKLVPGLAERWEWPNPRTLVLHLRKGVKFHDGTPFNAAAVKFSFDRIMNPAEQAIVRGEWKDVESVQVVDDQTVRISLKQPSGTFLAILSDRSGMVVSPAAARQLGDEFGRKPVGAGPFVFKEWVDGSHVTLVRNPGFWEAGFPKADKVTVYLFKSLEAATAAVKAGDLDFLNRLSNVDVPWVKGSADFELIDRPTIRVTSVWFNMAKAPIDDVNLRRAIQAALSRPDILRVAWGGIGQVGVSLYPQGFWSVDPTLPAPAYDPARAKKYLADSKYRGEKLVFITESVSAIAAQAQRASQMIQQYLGDVGITAEILPLSGTEEASRYFEKGEFHGRIGGWSGRPDPDINYFSLLGCGGSFNVPRDKGGSCDLKVDAFIQQGRNTPDPAQRMKAYAELDRYMIDQALFIPILHQSWSVAKRKTLTGFTPYIFGKVVYREMGLQP